MTPKSAKLCEIVLLACGYLDGRFVLIFRWNGITDTHEMSECMRPEFNINIIAEKEGTHRVCDSKMSTLDRTILVRSVSTCRPNFMSKVTKQTCNFWIVIKFPSLIKINMFVRNLR